MSTEITSEGVLLSHRSLPNTDWSLVMISIGTTWRYLTKN